MFWQETVLLKVHTQLFIRAVLKQLRQKREIGYRPVVAHVRGVERRLLQRWRHCSTFLR